MTITQLGLLDEVAGYVPAAIVAGPLPPTFGRVGSAVRRFRVGRCAVCDRGWRVTVWAAAWSRTVDGPMTPSTADWLDDGTGSAHRVPAAPFRGVQCCGQVTAGQRVRGSYNPGKVCNSACMGARGPSCDCACAGVNHGGGWAL